MYWHYTILIGVQIISEWKPELFFSFIGNAQVPELDYGKPPHTWLRRRGWRRRRRGRGRGTCSASFSWYSWLWRPTIRQRRRRRFWLLPQLVQNGLKRRSVSRCAGRHSPDVDEPVVPFPDRFLGSHFPEHRVELGNHRVVSFVHHLVDGQKEFPEKKKVGHFGRKTQSRYVIQPEDAHPLANRQPTNGL